MTPAETLPKLKRRIDDYLWREDGMPIQRLREILATKFEPLGPVAIIGGLVRDIARKGKVGFRSDIDLVIDAEPARVAALAAELNATPNRFGGFASVQPHWKIDFWSLPNTWASSVGLVRTDTLADLVFTTFFDCDAICYEVQKRKVHALPDYLKRLAKRSIDVNLLPNPSIDGNLLRASRRILLWHFRPGSALRAFIERELNEESFHRIVAIEQAIYPNDVLSTFGGPRQLADALLGDEMPTQFSGFGEQLELPGFTN
ncbi:hypothetical protein WJT74_01290 [Sphingomicrobium sp. XHP0239]|uniref:hypothetical protein n=1 Tax=Sphingomicrobium maritimum TaxID=3133972 RepID=UPI0031CCA9FB